MKRILAVFLTLAMALNIAPMGAFAAADSDAASIVAIEETDENASSQLDEQTARAIASDPFLQQLQSGAEQPKTEADPNETQVSGNGVLGNMLADRINALNAENGVGYSPDYGITDIVMDGSRATVSYDSAEEADLVVALYTEDTQEMVASGTMRVPAAANGTAELTIADVPDYYVVKGYLLNKEYAPLCNAYTKSLYTEAMDQIKNATTGDFEEDRVLNLDQNLDTNFMVVGENVSMMKDAASNVYADDDNQIYKFTDPNEEITSLKPGDIFVYEDTLTGVVVARVKETEWNGNTLVVYGDPEFDPSEAFDIIKIDDNAEGGDFTTRHDENTGVPFAYDDVEEMENDIISFNEENSAPSGSTTITGDITDEIPLDDKTGTWADLYGKIGYKVSGSVTYYSYKLFKLEYLQVKAGAEAYLDGGFKVFTPKAFKIPLGHAEALLSGGLLKLEIDAAFKVKIAVTGSVYLKASAESMFTWDHGRKDEDNTKTTGNVEVGVKLEGEVYAGVSLSVAVTTATGFIKVEAEASTGSQLTLKLDNDDLNIGGEIGTSTHDSRHSCEFCVKIEGERNFILSVSLKIWKKPLLLSGDKTGDDETADGDDETADNEGKWTVFKASRPMDEAYYSWDYHEFGWGSCPHRAYRVKITAGTNGANAELSITKDGSAVVSNKLDANGEYSLFLEPGSYTVKLAANNKEYTKTITVGSSAQTVEFSLEESKEDPVPEITWTLDENGTLTISGTGPMPDYVFSESPWHEQKDKIKKVIIKPGVTSVGACAFYRYGTLTDVAIPDGVTDIGSDAFFWCDKLEKIALPRSLKSMGEYAFYECNSLTEIVIPNGVTRVESCTFRACRSLTKVVIPAGVTCIDDGAFCNCNSLKEITIPAGVTRIGHEAFWYCSALEEIAIPDGVTSIGEHAFDSCTALTKVTLPDSVINIGKEAFKYCKALPEIVLPAGTTDIAEGTFEECRSLEKITIPASVTNIAEGAFYSCVELKDVYYTGTQQQWSNIQINSEKNDKLLSATIHYNSAFGGGGGGSRLSLDDAVQSVENSITAGAATEKSGTYYATFENAKAGKEYVVLVSRSDSASLNADNLIYINQITATADGELAVPFRTTADAAEMTYVVACAQDDVTNPTPADPDNPSGGGDGGGAAIIMIGGVAAVAAVAGVVLMMPVKVEGTVKLADQPVANASVQVLKNGNVAAQTTTDANGCFAVKVKRGSYTLRVQWTDAAGQPVMRTVDFKAPNANLNVVA